MSKKGSKAPKEVSTYEPNDIVLGKVRGYPAWPGQVVDPEKVSEQVRKERPSNKKSLVYCVQFFPTGDYAWLIPKDISKLQKHEIESYISEPFKKSGDLLSGYRIALDPRQWELEREALLTSYEEEANEAEIDQLESESGSANLNNNGEEDDESGSKAKSKKRKRESEPAKPKKAPKAPKPKKEKKEKEEPGVRKKGGASKKNGATKSKALVESEDEAEGEAEAEGEEDAGPSKKASPPPAKKAKRGKDEGEDSELLKDPEAVKVRDWRHKLQKMFLGSNQAQPRVEDMPDMDALFKSVETYDKINIVYLSFSKIGKVMRHIAALSDDKVPRDDEFKFRERAKALVDKWHLILNANKDANASAGANGALSANGAANGEVKGDAAENGAANGAVGAGAEGKGEPTDVEMKTAALDLNGQGVLSPPLDTPDLSAGLTSAGLVGDSSMLSMGDLADVTMSEAGAA